MPLDYIAFDADHKFAACLLGFGVRFGPRFLIENDLDDSGTIAHIEKQQIAKVAPPRHPAEDNGGLPCVGCAQRSAVVCAFQITEKVQHDNSLSNEKKNGSKDPPLQNQEFLAQAAAIARCHPEPT